jgi:very-short-patch-repair endonuclease
VYETPFRGSAVVAAGALTRGRLRGPGFRRLFDDVYVRADVPVDLALRSRAAHLLVVGRGVLAGYSAAEVLDASCGPDDAPAEVALPAGCLLRQKGLRVHRGLLEPDEVTTVGDIGVTTRRRTAYDLARRAPSLVEAVVAVDALALPSPARPASGMPRDVLPPGGPFLPADLLFLRNRHLGARNSRRLPEVVALADALAQSPMETRTRLALVLNGLPPPVSQFEVTVDAQRFYLDLAYPLYRVGIEYDGREHLTPERARRDLERQHLLSQVAWTLVRPRAAPVLYRPHLVAVQVHRELDRAAERLGLPKITVSGAVRR